MIRVYDKNAESKGEIAATRIEIQCMKDYASAIWNSLTAEPTYKNCCSITKSAILTAITDFGVKDLNDALQGSIADVLPDRREASHDTKLWLNRQVVPTLREDWLKNGKPDLLTWLVQQVGQSFETSYIVTKDTKNQQQGRP